MKKIWYCIHANYNWPVRLLALCLLLFSGSLPDFGQASEVSAKPDYRQIFGDRYTEAEQFFNSAQWIEASLLANGIAPHFARAVVFPEVIRYSSIRDKLELQGLFTLYVQYGAKYANFSVGRFQMKPTFAKQVESDVGKYFGHSEAAFASLDTSDTPEARMARVKRLESEQGQVQYLIAFIKIMDHRYGRSFGSDTLKKLQFYAAAYNCGYAKPPRVIRQSMLKNTFHTEIFSSKVKYNYADIALFYYDSRP